MKCLIVDDQKIFRTALKKYIALDSSLTLVGECEDAIQAYKKVSSEKIDLIFLDIRMPGMSGLELAELLKDKHPLVIFTSAGSEYAIEAFDLNVVDFLLKPISHVRFLKAIDKAKHMVSDKGIVHSDGEHEFVFVRESNVIRRIAFNDILYFEAKGDYVNIAMADQTFSIHSSLKAIEPKLPKSIFLRVHRSFIINISKIDTAEGRTLVINQRLVPVSDVFKTDLNKKMKFL